MVEERRKERERGGGREGGTGTEGEGGFGECALSRTCLLCRRTRLEAVNNYFLCGDEAVVMLSPLRVVSKSVHTAAHRLQRKLSLRAVVPLKESSRVGFRGRVRTRVSVCGCISKGGILQEREREGERKSRAMMWRTPHSRAVAIERGRADHQLTRDAIRPRLAEGGGSWSLVDRSAQVKLAVSQLGAV